MKRIPFQQVDVFTAVPFKGNPVAVVLESDELSTAEMQAIANWTNLSETTFVGPPTEPAADYRLRIFTPRAEIPFAGHPTIGSAHAVLRRGRVPKRAGHLVQECKKGLIELLIESQRLFFRLPEPIFTSPDERQRADAAAALGVAATAIKRAAVIDVGVVWFTVQLRDGEMVTNLKPDMAAIAALSGSALTGLNVFGFHKDGRPTDVEVRSFAPADGIPEDPVCGSGNGCVAALIHRDKLLDRNSYIASQGRCLQRDGRVEVRFEDDAIWLGGHAVTCIEGTLNVGSADHPQ
ncbi:MAG: PhzF family phenazine biosynthesis protein [Acidobacteria bacterium]|nr:MAG: PhzF family phenazine biosynthesis protein [Acidobacteriota bacterium]